jgi:hypothetical protein
MVGLLAAGCAEMRTKQEAYPALYDDQQEVSIVVVPAINQTTAANAGDYLDVTVAQPFSNHGYYVLPMPIVSEIFDLEGIVDGEQLLGAPASLFRDSFGADGVLFITIEKWETNYLVIAGNVTVGLSYVLKSTVTDEVLWSYEGELVLDTSGSSGNILADVIVTAINTATADYVPVATRVHGTVLAAMPYGVHHPEHGTDGEMETVDAAARDEAVQVEN